MDEFTDRTLETVILDKIDDDWTVHFKGSWSFGGVPPKARSFLQEGATYFLETRNISLVTGMASTYVLRGGEPAIREWLWHKSDAELDREHEEMVAKFEADKQELWERHHEEWAERESKLPEVLRARIQRFRDAGGHSFEVNGWGYELIICELAVLYAQSGQEDTDEIMAFAHAEGTSGNQHEYAKAMSRHLSGTTEDDQTVVNAVSALTPLTGDPDYSGQQ